MATLTILGVTDAVRDRLRVEAARNGRSMEAEVRAMLEARYGGPAPATGGLGSRIHARFAELGGAELDLPARSERPRAADFGQ
jgi:plasmid stability protein